MRSTVTGAEIKITNKKVKTAVVALAAVTKKGNLKIN